MTQDSTNLKPVQKNRGTFRMYSGVYRVGEFKHATRIFKGAMGVAMATKFRQKLAKIARISFLCKKLRNLSHK